MGANFPEVTQHDTGRAESHVLQLRETIMAVDNANLISVLTALRYVFMYLFI